jgi:hypothetical protein
MKMIDISGKRIIYPLLFIILSGIILYNVYNLLSPSGQYKVRAFKVAGGWGYQIIQNEKVYVNQPFIPLVQGKTAFPNKKSALGTGKIVLKRIQQHQLPVLTLDDLKQLGLDTSKTKP